MIKDDAEDFALHCVRRRDVNGLIEAPDHQRNGDCGVKPDGEFLHTGTLVSTPISVRRRHCSGLHRRVDALLRVEDYIEQQQTNGGENDVVADQQLDPERRIAFAGEDRSAGNHHRQQRREKNRKQNQR